MKSRSRNLFVGLVLGVSLGTLCILGEDKEVAKPKKNLQSSSMQLLMSAETPFSQDLKALSELIVGPKDLDVWKHQGVISSIIPSILGKRNKRLPKFFVLNLFNPFAGKQYGYVDPLAPYHGARSGGKGFFNVETADMKGVPLFGSQW